MESIKPSNAQTAREALGLTIVQAAQKARITPAYLRRIELYGKTPYPLACRLASIYGCPLDTFLRAAKSPHPKEQRDTKKQIVGRPRATARAAHPGA